MQDATVQAAAPVVAPAMTQPPRAVVQTRACRDCHGTGERRVARSGDVAICDACGGFGTRTTTVVFRLPCDRCGESVRGTQWLLVIGGPDGVDDVVCPSCRRDGDEVAS